MKVRFEPYGVTMEANSGDTILQAAIQAGVEIEAVCGGRGTCAKCRVIAANGLAPLTASEKEKLSPEELAKGYRLACQAVLESDTEVIVPEESRISRVSILSEGMQREIDHKPWAKRYTLQVAPATLEHQTPDYTNLENVWVEKNGTDFLPTIRALRQLPSALREDDGRITLVAVDHSVVRIKPGNGPTRVLGIAFDIGTTTIVGYLHDLETGQQLAVASELNPQTRYGDDVVSRIEFASRDEASLEILRDEVVGAINRLIEATTQVAEAAIDDIYAIVLVGNTTMHHLFLGISPAALAQSPYVPVVTGAIWDTASQLGIHAYPDAHVHVLPNIAGWVGADTVGVLLATGLHLDDEIALAIDIGTNGEMALGSRGRIITCSTAAGPAFEGAQLSCGMRAADGAIEGVKIDGDVQIKVIGKSAPRGVCGSGLVDLIAQMLDAGIIKDTGMLSSPEDLVAAGKPGLASKLGKQGRQRTFELVSASEGANGRPVIVTQRDIRELQLAKGAMRAGIEILIKELGISPDRVDKVYLAGAFGNYIRPESALRIGLIPEFPNGRIIPVGNAAGSGAKMALLSSAARQEATDLISDVEYLELSGRPDFQEQFSESMLF